MDKAYSTAARRYAGAVVLCRENKIWDQDVVRIRVCYHAIGSSTYSTAARSCASAVLLCGREFETRHQGNVIIKMKSGGMLKSCGLL